MTGTHNPGLLWRVVDLSFEVDYRQFFLVEDGSDGPEPDDVSPVEPAWAASGEGWLTLLSGGSGHHPTLTLEAWQQEPSPEQRTWDDQCELDVTFDEETLRIWGTASGPSSGPSFVLPASVSKQYRVRIFRASNTRSASVAQQVVDLIDSDLNEDGIYALEEWLFQFWSTERGRGRDQANEVDAGR